MQRYQDIWQEHCRAAEDVLKQHGPLSALDYIVGEKLMRFLATAETHPEFAREVPAFVAHIRQLFGTEALATYVAHLDQSLREQEQVDDGEHDDDDGLPSASLECREQRQRLERVRELLTVDRLGTG